ncbi:MAG: FHA domain-containing protein [Thermoplasmatota archaeon]
MAEADEKAAPPNERLTASLRALASERRLDVISLLQRPRYIEEIARDLKISRQGAQEHLAQLVAEGIVEKQHGQRETGTVVEYRLVRARIFAILEELREMTAVPIDPSSKPLFRTMALPSEVRFDRSESAEIVVLNGPELGARIALRNEAKAVLLGRDPECRLKLDWDLQVSNRHAEIRKDSTVFVIVDTFSRNGTVLNGRTMQPGTPAKLRSGDVISLGRTLVLFRE